MTYTRSYLTHELDKGCSIGLTKLMYDWMLPLRKNSLDEADEADEVTKSSQVAKMRYVRLLLSRLNPAYMREESDVSSPPAPGI